VAQARHDFDVTVLACKHADGQWNTRPHSETVVQPGCQMIALGTLPNLQKLLALARG
jgi:K+/H+ antiporter YhaU regulatory subunit KhtT